MCENAVTALVPMKAHSERVPNKNIRDFCGKPLYEWILDALSKSRYIRQIIVNTDSDYIMDQLSNRGYKKVIGVSRPNHLRGDMVSMNQIIAYDLSIIEGMHFLQSHTTNPLLSTATIDKAVECYFENIDQFDSVLSVVEHKSRMYKSGGIPINHDLSISKRSQEEEPIFEENSNIFLFSKDSFKGNSNNRVGKRPYLFRMDKIESTDIDEEQDFIIAEMLQKYSVGRL